MLFIISSISFAGSFEKSGEYYRYFEDDGSVAYDKIVEVERQKYYVNSDGYASFNSWVDKDGKKYYADNKGILFSDGVKEIDGYKYYFNDEGELQKGWINDYMYYADDDAGYLLSGFQELLIPSDMITEVDKEKSAWFYFDTVSCKKYFAENDAYICKTVGTSKYCFDQNGIIRTGWRLIKDTTPVMKGYMYFKEETDNDFKYGEAITDSWYAIEPPTEILPNAQVRYFYFNGQGVPRCAPQGKLSKVRLNEKTYLFNEYGFAVYGIHVVDNEYYYFGDGVNNCSMKTGLLNYDVDGSGDGASYYFEDEGRGYSGVYKNKLYYKGKLQMASEEQKYAAITVGGLTRLVNTSGQVMKSKKKIKDGDGCAWSTGSGGIVTYRDDDASDTPPMPPELSGDN